MTQISTLASKVVNSQIEIHAYRNKTFGHLRVGLFCKFKEYPIYTSETSIDIIEKNNIQFNEFIVAPHNSNRAILKEVRNCFTDTGKRVQLNNNLWGEVWQLKPEQINQLSEKENQNERPEQAQSQFEPYP